MKTNPRKRSVTIQGHRTSFSLEDIFFTELEAIAKAQNISIAGLIARVDKQRPKDSNLSSSLRIFIFKTVKQQSSQE